MNPAAPQAAQAGLPLKDIHLPPAISAWPPAPGWWIGAIALVVIIVAIIFAIVRYRQRTAYRRAALAAARQCCTRLDQHQSKTRFAADCSELLRRVAIAAYGTPAAGISGSHWLRFLDEKVLDEKLPADKKRGGKTATPLFSNLAPALLEAPYRPTVDYDVQALQHALLHWIKHHKVNHKARHQALKKD